MKLRKKEPLSVQERNDLDFLAYVVTAFCSVVATLFALYLLGALKF